MTAAIRLARDGILRELDRFIIFSGRVQGPCPRNFSFRQTGLEKRRLFCGRSGAIYPYIVASIIIEETRTGIRTRSVGQREFWVEGDRLLEHLARKLEILFRQAAHITLAAEVEVVRLKIFGWFRRELCLLLRRQCDAQSFRDLAGNLVLQLEDILHLAIITF